MTASKDLAIRWTERDILHLMESGINEVRVETKKARDTLVIVVSELQNRLNSFGELRKLDIAEQLVRHERVGEQLESMAKKLVTLWEQLDRRQAVIQKEIKSLSKRVYELEKR